MAPADKRIMHTNYFPAVKAAYENDGVLREITSQNDDRSELKHLLSCRKTQ